MTVCQPTSCRIKPALQAWHSRCFIFGLKWSVLPRFLAVSSPYSHVNNIKWGYWHQMHHSPYSFLEALFKLWGCPQQPDVLYNFTELKHEKRREEAEVWIPPELRKDKCKLPMWKFWRNSQLRAVRQERVSFYLHQEEGKETGEEVVWITKGSMQKVLGCFARNIQITWPKHTHKSIFI